MATVGIDPTNFGILNDHPTKIPPGELLGGVVKNCRFVLLVMIFWCFLPIVLTLMLAGWYCAACNDFLLFFADCADADACWLVLCCL